MSLKVGMLENKIILQNRFKNSYRFSGLLGNVNGNPDDDFELPNGTTLPSNLTESEIYTQFGEHCMYLALSLSDLWDPIQCLSAVKIFPLFLQPDIL